jgi:hypothetical protein
VSDLVITSRLAGPQRALSKSRGLTARVAADWLCLAATPTFALMALATALLPALGGSEPDLLCAAMPHVSPLDEMIPMYLLMSAFHATPWLKLICGGGSPTSRHRRA